MDGKNEGYRDSHQGCGPDYHDRFANNPRRRMMWQIERRVLREILDRYRDNHEHLPDYLDFACGTGRVLGFVAPHTATAVGVDVSPSMLELARQNVPGVRLLEADLTHGETPLDGRHFDLVTAFRFFPNAEPELRRDAISALTDHLRPGGRLVFNNHRSLSSLRHRLVRLLTLGRRGHGGMSPDEVTELISEAGLEIETVSHAGVVPEYEWLLLRPRWIIEWLERLATRLPLARVAENLIYVCRKPVPEAHRLVA